MDKQPRKVSALSLDGDAAINVIAASIREQFGSLGEAVVQRQLDAADGSALVNWQAIGRRLADLQGRRE